MCTRLNDLGTGHKVVIQQRLHEQDVTGDLLIKGGFELLCLPAEFEPELRCTTSIGWTDPLRTWRTALAGKDHPGAARSAEGLAGLVSLRRTIPAAAVSGRWWHFQAFLVSVLAPGPHGSVSGNSEVARADEPAADRTTHRCRDPRDSCRAAGRTSGSAGRGSSPYQAKNSSEARL